VVFEAGAAGVENDLSDRLDTFFRQFCMKITGQLIHYLPPFLPLWTACASAEPAAVLLFADVRLSRRTLDAALAAFGEVTLLLVMPTHHHEG
jgi:hypothetical protein